MVAPLVPVAVHTAGVAEVNVTAFAEAPPLADTVKAASEVSLLVSAPKEIVCAMADTAIVVTELSDEEYVASPE